ncbi:hypothetical protein CWS43_10265 [Rahnella sp. AA]|uniref:hypothetical protein n=1 Tax=Rahnella sp. AA TaxID=2057180 RepID=UPI000C31F2B6|nr:hypothetical protein [Rahnella sp. AA]PKE31051.1 hypothetical protein CWS43_10265 [Rahnella sp. AA]
MAGVRQEVIARVVASRSTCANWFDPLDVVKQLAQLTAVHTHSNTGTRLNALAITGTCTKITT